MKSKINIKKLSTEKRNLNSVNIDKKSALEIAKLINKEDKKVALAIEKIIFKIGDAIEVCSDVFKKGGRIIYIGAGSSGRIGILDASEMEPTYGIKSNLVIGLIAGGKKAIQHAIENVEDNTKISIKDLKSINFSKKDVLIGISASGQTPYVLSGLIYARKLNAKTISISTSKNSEIGKISNICIEAIVGPEIITGSTRMKSGTAQKMILNMISTGTMIQNGFIYENLMVNLKCNNKKLKERAILIVSEITGEENLDLIKTLLIKSKFNLKSVIDSIKSKK